MTNPWAGEAALVLDGRRRVLRLTLGALAALEAELGEGDGLVALVARFEAGRFRTRDVVAVLLAGLRGGGWEGRAAALLEGEIGGGPVEAARIAGLLLARGFALPGPST
ncbi:gene transfer agent family protein [Jannaschia sp. W003]|uniref:gene transfer agent family protein n=1 Tax=Jannaschia sp. W003 TaxID=2867012 RepID=UPI0021A911F3|nr:gene transfer agent family protein [Jannaschia sp. W003]UWQ21003.1 gene transfer agent family protein [Jannaschia sp. W003]